MRRRPDSTYGVVEALIARSIEEARGRGLRELSLGLTPRIFRQEDGGTHFARAHVPPLPAVAAWLRSLRSPGASAPPRAREFA